MVMILLHTAHKGQKSNHHLYSSILDLLLDDFSCPGILQQDYTPIFHNIFGPMDSQMAG